MSKIAFITAKAPFGSGEAFVLSELCAFKELGADILVVPRDFLAEIFHKKAETLVRNTLSLPWLDLKIAKEFIKFIYCEPILFLKLIKEIAYEARNAKIGLKNLIVLPKAIFLATVFKQKYISHIHAHWGTTTATMAYIIYRITRIPWSFTAHRWDIPEDNILKCKCSTTSFVRCIDEKGLEELAGIVNEASSREKLSMIHMGVGIPEITNQPAAKSEVFTFLCPANFVLKKGHKYLIEGCKRLSASGVKFKCFIAGDGQLEGELKEMVNSLKLNDCIEFLNRLPHEELFDMYAGRGVDAVVLPSILTDDGEKEGIPVALMEAMSYGIPVISTNTGGISELIGDDSGIMVAEKDPEAIASAMGKLIKDPAYYHLMSERGRRKIETDFNLNVISTNLLGRMITS